MRKTVNIIKKMRATTCKISIFCSFVRSIFTLFLMCLKFILLCLLLLPILHIKIVRYFRYKCLASLKGRLRAFWWFTLNFVLWLRIFLSCCCCLVIILQFSGEEGVNIVLLKNEIMYHEAVMVLHVTYYYIYKLI